MAEATQATTSTDVTATTATVSDLPPAGEQTASDAATPGETTASEPVSALERAAAAIEKQAAAKKDEPAADKAAEDAAKDAKPAEEKKPEPEKKDDPRLSRALAIIAEREEVARKLQKSVESERSAWAKENQANSADLQIVRNVRDALTKGDQLAALEVLGIDLPKAVELMSRRLEPTPEDIQRMIVREEIEAREKTRVEAEAKATAAKTERERAEETVAQTEFLDRVMALDGTKYPFTTQRKLSGGDIWNFSKKLAGELGRSPTALETIERIEKLVRDDYEAGSKLLKPAELPPPVPSAAKISETKSKAPERDKASAEQQSRRPGKRESASERAEAALKRAGYH